MRHFLGGHSDESPEEEHRRIAAALAPQGQGHNFPGMNQPQGRCFETNRAEQGDRVEITLEQIPAFTVGPVSGASSHHPR